MAIGKSVIRTDAVAKVTGRAEYTEDMQRPGMLAAKYFRATISHGRVLTIDTSKAKAIEGVEVIEVRLSDNIRSGFSASPRSEWLMKKYSGVA